MQTLFPMFVKLESRPCLIVGPGRVGESKIQGLLASRAVIHVVGRRATPQVRKWARTGKISWTAREFQAADLDGVFLVVVATSSAELNDRVWQEARRRGVLCNVVDDPARCDFYYPAVVRRGPLQIAISTAGNSPALAQRLRRQLEKQFGPEYEAWVEELGKARQELFSRAMDPEHRRRLLHELASKGPARRRA